MTAIVNHLGRPFAETIAPEYEGASTGRRMSLWGLSGAGPNSVIAGGHTSIKNRARTLRRNNPVVAGGVDAYVANLVGTDISPSWDLDNQEQKQELQDAWEMSVWEMDYSGSVDFYALQEQAAASMIVDGESLARMVTRPRSFGLLVPLQVQMLECDHLDVSYNDFAKNGNEIRLGIEWSNGQRAAYHLWKEHPGEQFLTAKDSFTRERVPAGDIAHVFRPLRAGQQRGGSFLASILTKLYEIDQYDDAEVVRKKCAAMWQPFFVNKTPGAKPTSFNASSIELEPGIGVKMPQGWEVQFSEPADVGANYETFMKVQFRMVAKGLGITYEQLSGDLAGVTFSSIRAGLIEFRRLIEMIRMRTLVGQFTRPIVLKWMTTGVLAGAFKTITPSEYFAKPRRFQRISFIPQAFDYVQPVVDRQAIQMDIRNGLTTREEQAKLRGKDIERIDRANMQRNAIMDDYGLVYDCDPRKTTKQGQRVSE